MFNGMPPSPFPPGSGPVGPYNTSLPNNEYMGPSIPSIPSMTLPQHFQSGPHQHPPGHPQGPSLPPDQTSLSYQPQG